MSWKKLLLIAAVAGAFTFASAPKSDAGVSVGVGIGFPVGYYGCGYPYGYYPYGYYPYPYVYPSFVAFSRPVVFRNSIGVRHHPRIVRHRPR